MESALSERNGRASKRRPDGRRDFTRYDQALSAAKNARQLVVFELAVETNYTNHEDNSCRGIVCTVDDFAIELELESSGKKVWIAKPMIVVTEVLV